MSRWISVHESVPEQEVEVIVNLHYEDGIDFVTTGWTYRDINNNVIWYVEDTDPEDSEDYIVTHWWPFPKPPRKKEILAELDCSRDPTKIYNQELSKAGRRENQISLWEETNMSDNGEKETWVDKAFKELMAEAPSFTLCITDKDSDGLDTYVKLGEATVNFEWDNKEE